MPTDLLIIDDTPTDLRLLIEIASSLNLRVSVAFDGRKGCQQARLQQPSLILLDVRMPGMDGYAVGRRLKADPVTSSIPIIFLTVAKDLDERLTGFEIGAVDYICKPFHEAEVLARIGVHIPIGRKADDTAKPACGSGEAAVDGSQQAVLVRAAKSILNDRIACPPTLGELARQLGTNRRQLNDAFQACCGQPTFGWLREERMLRAHRLIRSSETPVAVIGVHLGYPNPANFSRAFQNSFGISPSDLRRNKGARNSDEPDPP